MVLSLMLDAERVKSGVRLIQPNTWAALILAILTPFAMLGAIMVDAPDRLFGYLFWGEVGLLVWVYFSSRPYLIVRQWQRTGEFERRDWSPVERRLERGGMLVYLYRTSNADSHRTVSIDELKQFGDWTFAELHNLLSPLVETGLIKISTAYAPNHLIAFAEATIRLTPAGVLATEDAVTQARQQPGYSVTIHGNDNQVQVATVNSEQLRNT
jgi:hypothetical protein